MMRVKPIKQPCAVCRGHIGGKPIKIRVDSGMLEDATNIAHCPYCGRFLEENYAEFKEDDYADER